MFSSPDTHPSKEKRRGSLSSIWASPTADQRHISIDLSVLDHPARHHLVPHYQPDFHPLEHLQGHPSRLGNHTVLALPGLSPQLLSTQSLNQGPGAQGPLQGAPNFYHPQSQQGQQGQQSYMAPYGQFPGPAAGLALNQFQWNDNWRGSYADSFKLSSPLFAPPQSTRASISVANSHRRHSSAETFGPRDPAHEPADRDDGAYEKVHEYFSADPHDRVKVTAEYLAHRFYEEEKYLSDLFQLPKFPMDASLPDYQLVLVAFKAGRIDVFYLPDNTAELHAIREGDLIIVEADRGRDLGEIVKLNISIDEARLLKLLQFLEQQAALSENTSVNDLSVKLLQYNTHHHGHSHGHAAATAPPTLHFPKSVLALAQPNEVVQVLNKSQDEEKACRLCLAKIASATSMLSFGDNSGPLTSSDLQQMKLVDAEYQFDRRKLIFYYSTSKRIDFRDLVRELFRIYKTRIWMCAVNGNPYVPQHVQKPKQRVGAGSKQHELPAKQAGVLQSSPTQTFKSFRSWEAPTDNHDAAESRFSYQAGHPVYQDTGASEVPRKFHGETIHEETSPRESGESLVLKSLVDTLNH